MSAGEDAGASRMVDPAELDRLRRENRLLRVEKEMLLKIATDYALEHRVGAREQRL